MSDDQLSPNDNSARMSGLPKVTSIEHLAWHDLSEKKYKYLTTSAENYQPCQQQCMLTYVGFRYDLA